MTANGTLRDDLRTSFPVDRVLCDEPMAKHTSFAVGGPAEFFVDVHDATEIVTLIKIAKRHAAPWHVIGCGSNILVSDAGLPGIVIHIGAEFSHVEIDGTKIHAQAGATNKQVADAALAAGLAGYEFASGIPGSVGGAAIMNAGAYDGEFRDVAESVECLTPDGELVTVSAADARWRYRGSMMMDAGYIVTGATIALAPADTESIQAKMTDLETRRRDKQPLEYPSAGSTFKRPTGHFAGKLIDEAGMRGHRVGGAMVSEKHAGFVVNVDNATAADVLQVIHDVQDAIYASAGVRLETEVRLWGFEE